MTKYRDGIFCLRDMTDLCKGRITTENAGRAERRKAAEGNRTPRPGGMRRVLMPREASRSAVAFCRFGNRYPARGYSQRRKSFVIGPRKGRKLTVAKDISQFIVVLW